MLSRRKLLPVVCCLTLVVFGLYFFSGHDTYLPVPASLQDHRPGDISILTPDISASDHIASYVKAILDPSDAHLPRLECPKSDLSRYEYLKPTHSAASQTQYFFALNLRECLPLLPRLLGSMVEAIRFLGPEHCAVSIVEGNSQDETAEVLAALQPELEKLLGGRTHFVLSNAIDPLDEVRFSRLAELRNQALQPMLGDPERYAEATVIFLNDVAICLEDVLELVHQRRFLGADMTCAFDWTFNDDGGSIFYDSYVARGINGDLFFDIPPDTASYALARNLFWNEPQSRERLQAHRPFQVFSCWNGAVAFTAAPVVDGKVAFRAARQDEGECYQSEPQAFCKDMWFQGYGKIAVVPSINLEYSNEKGRMAKEDKGYTSQWTHSDTGAEDRIEWQPPPDTVKCMPTFDNQFWRPWNETLG